VEREMINTPKVMIISSWNISEVKVIKAIVDESFNADYSVQHILRLISVLQIVTMAHKPKKRLP
jgi:hypothetical protein